MMFMMFARAFEHCSDCVTSQPGVAFLIEQNRVGYRFRQFKKAQKPFSPLAVACGPGLGTLELLNPSVEPIDVVFGVKRICTTKPRGKIGGCVKQRGLEIRYGDLLPCPQVRDYLAD